MPAMLVSYSVSYYRRPTLTRAIKPGGRALGRLVPTALVGCLFGHPLASTDLPAVCACAHPVKVWRSHPEDLDLDGWAQVPPSPVGDDARGLTTLVHFHGPSLS
jgi:hypothetical protein